MKYKFKNLTKSQEISSKKVDLKEQEAGKSPSSEWQLEMPNTIEEMLLLLCSESEEPNCQKYELKNVTLYLVDLCLKRQPTLKSQQ